MTCYSSANKITHEEWLETDYCECSKPVFKYHDITNNVFVLKCKNGNVSVTGNVHENVYNVSNVSNVSKLIDSFESMDLTVKNRKTRCNLFEVYEAGSYEDSICLQIKTKKQTQKKAMKEINENLKDRLDILFDYAKVNNINDRINLTIQEINYIVKFKLHRITIGKFYRVGKETLEDYRERIFSRPIIDKSIKFTKKKKKTNESHFITEPLDFTNSEHESDDSVAASSSELESESESDEVSEIGSEIQESVADYEDYGYCSDYSD